jgi:hypothetical protein
MHDYEIAALEAQIAELVRAIDHSYAQRGHHDANNLWLNHAYEALELKLANGLAHRQHSALRRQSAHVTVISNTARHIGRRSASC